MVPLRLPLPTPWQIVPSAEYQREHPPKSAEDLEREVRARAGTPPPAFARQRDPVRPTTAELLFLFVLPKLYGQM